MIELNKIYNEDCLEGMKRIPDGSVDLIATDVPYRITSRGNAGSSGGMMQKDLSMKGKIFEDNDIKIEEYLPEFYRILKEKSHCYIMCNHINLTHFLKVIDESNFHFIKCLVWVKDNKIMGSFYMNQFEYIIMLRKGGRKTSITAESLMSLCSQTRKIEIKTDKTFTIVKSQSVYFRRLFLKAAKKVKLFSTHSWVAAPPPLLV